jgi:predicted nucleic acid-binding protein
MRAKRVFVDTNVLIKSYTAKYTGDMTCEKCMNYLLKREDTQLYTTVQAIIVMFSTLQKARKNRPAIDKKRIIDYYHKLLPKIEVLNCTKQDIENSFKFSSEDLEDNFQYAVGQKVDCIYYVTENKADFSDFPKILIVHPKKPYFL